MTDVELYVKHDGKWIMRGSMSGCAAVPQVGDMVMWVDCDAMLVENRAFVVVGDEVEVKLYCSPVDFSEWRLP